MKKVLITGENSYIGTAVEQWLNKSPEQFEVTTISVRGEEWKSKDFSIYDAVFHVAGIAHADTGKLTDDQKEQYYKINCDLAYEVANKFKEDRRRKKSQFIYMSSIIVYDDTTNVRKKRVITHNTKPNPSSFYGDSKLQAEINLSRLIDQQFILAIVRPPMIYGKDSKGNYPMLAKMAKKIPIFPNIDNQRSMLHIYNLSEFVKFIILDDTSGVLFPQNTEYVKTSNLVREIAKVHHHHVIFISLFNWLIILLSYFPGKIGNLTNKAFGNLVYDKSMSVETIKDYQVVTFEESIKVTEKDKELNE